MRKIVLAGVVTLAVLGVLAAPEAKAGGPSSFGLSIQTPGFGLSYRQGYPVYAPPPVVVAGPPVVVPAPVVVSPPVLVPAYGAGWYGGYTPHYHHHHQGYPYAGPYRGGWR